MKKYTLGEVFRLGLLKNYKGEPYKHKATISRLLRGAKYEIVETPWGQAKVFTEEEIQKASFVL